MEDICRIVTVAMKLHTVMKVFKKFRLRIQLKLKEIMNRSYEAIARSVALKELLSSITEHHHHLKYK